MPQFTNVGLYKGEIKDFGVTVTRTAKLPQFVVSLRATEILNEAEEVWEDYAKYDEVITGYFVLVTLDKQGRVVKCLNYDQVMEATGWNGETYSGLAAMDLKTKQVQFRVIEDTYEGNTSLKVNWIAAVDAETGLKKLTGKDLTDLDAKFGTVAVKKTVAKSTTAKKAKKATPPKATPPKATSKVESEDAVDETPCSEGDAYDACVVANTALDNPVPTNILDDYWLSHATELAADPDNITEEEAPLIRNATLNDINIPF